jgi:hypothetical protein
VGRATNMSHLVRSKGATPAYRSGPAWSDVSLCEYIRRNESNASTNAGANDIAGEVAAGIRAL